jgi:hypothetical protein
MNLSVQIIFLILGAGVTGAFGMWCLMKSMGYSRYASGHSEEWIQDRYARQANRTLWIKNWASERMATVPMKLKTEDRQVLVSYKDLTTIWDLSDKIWMDLGD